MVRSPRARRIEFRQVTVISPTASYLIAVGLLVLNVLLVWADGDGFWFPCLLNAFLALIVSHIGGRRTVTLGAVSISFHLGEDTVTGKAVRAATIMTHYLAIGIIYLTTGSGRQSVYPPEWTFIDALYFAITTMSTVGYGDLYIQGGFTNNKRFATFYALLGLAVFSAIAEPVAAAAAAFITWLRRKVPNRFLDGLEPDARMRAASIFLSLYVGFLYARNSCNRCSRLRLPLALRRVRP